MKNIFENIIRRGGYDLTALLKRIDTYHVEGKLSDSDRDELYMIARQTPEAQYDYRAEIEKLWAAIRDLRAGQSADNSQDPSVNDYPAFVQPSGAHDAYQTGAKITFKGDRYVCKMANCVWSPEVLPSAWELVETV